MPRTLLRVLFLALALVTTPWAPAPASAQSAPAPGSTTTLAARPRRYPAVTDSARRAYRRWLRHLALRARADSIARADSLARARAAVPAVGPAAPAATGGAPAAAAPESSATNTGRDYLAEIRADFTPRNRAYSTTRAVLGFVDPLYGILVALLLLFSGLSAGLRDLAHRAGRNGYVRALVYFALYSVVGFVLGLPLALYGDFGLEHAYGLSHQGFGPWLGEQLIGMGGTIVFFGVLPLLSLAYRAMRRHPGTWWLIVGLCTLPVMLFAVFLQPLIFDPLTNKFTPLQDKRLEASILEITGRAGIPAQHVFQADKSRQTVKYNAYVTGFGPSQRVVLWDTTLKGMSRDEILFVVAHESAHYRLHHVWKLVIGMTLMALVLLGLTAVTMRWAVRRWGRRWGFHEAHDLASLPLLIATVSVYGFLAMPLFNTFDRAVEHDADTFGLELTHANDAAARAFLKLGAQNRSNPEPAPIVEWFEYSHPPLYDRVRFALEYRPWSEGRPNRLFRPGPGGR
jgi:STE24 endopeptidase